MTLSKSATRSSLEATTSLVWPMTLVGIAKISFTVLNGVMPALLFILAATVGFDMLK